MQDNEQLKTWLSTATNIPIITNLFEALKDGQILTALIYVLHGESPPSYTSSSTKMSSLSFFKRSEAINKFLESAKLLGVPEHELFLTVDLLEEKNLKQVEICLYSLLRNAKKKGTFEGSIVGPELCDKRVIEFSDDVRRRHAVPIANDGMLDLSEYVRNVDLRREISGKYTAEKKADI